MTMSPREVVTSAIRNEGPERLPVRMDALGVNDTRWVGRRPAGGRQEGELRIDEWGCAWAHTEMHNMGQVKVHPMEDLSQLDRITVPDYDQDFVYEDCEEALRDGEKHDRYTQHGIFMILFERMHSLAGFENVLIGLLDDREHAAALADTILEAQMTLVRNFQERFGRRLHSFSMTEDWGTQQAAFVSMDLWREFFLPRYRRLFAAMHAGGQDVWVHSCGKVNEVVEGLIEAGCNVVNLQQPRALGIEEIGRRYRGRITFESLADIQATLPTGRRELIERDVDELKEHWMSRAGGFILSDYGDGRAIGAEPEAKRMMYDAFSRASEELYGKPLPAPAQ